MRARRWLRLPTLDPDRKLERRLRDALDDAGCRASAGMRVSIDGGEARVHDGELHGSAPVHDAEGGIHPALIDAALRLSQRVNARRRRELLDRRLDAGADRLCMQMIHPLALALITRADVDAIPQLMRKGWFDVDEAAPDRWTIKDYALRAGCDGLYDFSRLMLCDEEGAVRIMTDMPRTDDGFERVEFAMAETIPLSIAAACAGRLLVDIVAIPCTGRCEVDAALEAIVVEGAQARDTSTIFTLSPTTWVPCAPLPPEHAGHDRIAVVL